MSACACHECHFHQPVMGILCPKTVPNMAKEIFEGGGAGILKLPNAIFYDSTVVLKANWKSCAENIFRSS